MCTFDQAQWHKICCGRRDDKEKSRRGTVLRLDQRIHPRRNCDLLSNGDPEDIGKASFVLSRNKEENKVKLSKLLSKV